MQWYYAENGQQRGPVDDDALATLVNSGAVRDDTLVWHEGMQNWQSYGSARGAAAPPGVTAPGIAVQATPASAYVPENYATRPQSVRYAGFWIRFLARLIDGILLNVALMVVRLPLGLSLMGPISTREPREIMAAAVAIIVGSLVSLAVGAGYEIFFVSARGATLGKMALGLKVVRPDGAPISLGQSAGRYCAQFLSALTLFIGYIMAGFDEQKRSLHDRICETRVIHIR
ncbi:MAG: RDD family protein [Bryobacteraceae bacterium]